MKLMHVWINGYKHLKDTHVSFNKTPSEGIFKDALPLRFFIGLNGSGKSVFLEALCLLFSRVVQNEVPGFDFSLAYCIRRQGKDFYVKVCNRTGEHKLDIQVSEGENSQPYTISSFSGRMELLPDYVFTCASGRNNNFYDIVVQSPKTSLYSDLFDASRLGKSRLSAESRRVEITQILRSLKRLEENPICIFIDEQNAVFTLIAFFAALPGHFDSSSAEEYLSCRREVLRMLTSAPQPVSVTLVLDAKTLTDLGDELREYGPLFSTMYTQEKQPESPYAWDTERLYQDEALDSAGDHGDRVITFLLEPCPSKSGDDKFIQYLSDAYSNPMELLSKLVLARNRGIIKDAHIAFHIQGTDDLLLENALSEGEYMLLVRLGLLALGRQGNRDCQCLYLLDEPDVYLNEHWNVDFVSMIHRLYQNTQPQHEIIVATHSSLILTDALPDQLYYFQQREHGVDCYNIKASTFGGSRNEIMQALFQTENSVGNYAYEKVNEILKHEDRIEELEKLLDNVGSGYLRLRLLDKIQTIKEGRG
jgi:Predicted ATPase